MIDRNVEPCLTTAQTRYLLAVLMLLERDGRATFQSVSDVLDVNLNATRGQLLRLRKLGFVTWHDHHGGTLRSPFRFERTKT